MSFAIKTEPSPCGEGPAYDRSRQWHAGGCGVVSGVRGYLRDRDTWWRERRESVPLGPRESITSPRGGDDESRKRRAYIEEVMSVGSRSDWGVSVAPSGGELLFGAGHRDFAKASRTAGTQRQSARPIRDATFRAAAPGLNDGRWHDVVVVRRRRTPAKGGVEDFDEASGAPHAPSPHDAAELRVYIDGRRVTGAFETTGGRPGDAGVHEASNAGGGSPGRAGSAPPHPLVDAPANATLGEFLRGCLRDVWLHDVALSDDEIAKGAAALAKLAAPRPARDKPIPLYFYAFSDEGSREMRDRFVHSVRDALARAGTERRGAFS